MVDWSGLAIFMFMLDELKTKYEKTKWIDGPMPIHLCLPFHVLIFSSISIFYPVTPFVFIPPLPSIRCPHLSPFFIQNSGQWPNLATKLIPHAHHSPNICDGTKKEKKINYFYFLVVFSEINHWKCERNYFREMNDQKNIKFIINKYKT